MSSFQDTISGSLLPVFRQVLTEEHWTETNNLGITIFQHTIEKLPNGVLYQETFDNDSVSYIVRGPDYYGIFGNDVGDPFWCVSKSIPQSLSQITYPFYIDSPELSKDYFTMRVTSVASEPIPPLPLRAVQAVPQQTLTVPGTFQTWEGTGQTNHPPITETVRFDTDTDGRIITTDIRHFDASGKQVSDQWYSLGAFDFYAASQVTVLPSWVFNIPAQVTKGC